MAKLTKKQARQRRHRRLRRKVAGTAETPRMAVCTTNKHIYIQFVDDDKGHTLVAVSTLDPEIREKSIKADMDGALALGQAAAERAKAAGITRVVFDRGGFKYHGRIKQIAEAARKGGLKL